MVYYIDKIICIYYHENIIMTAQYHKNFYNPSYLQSLLREADDKKYILGKELFEVNNLSYERGSRKNDYTIRDRLRDISTTIDQYYDMVKYFDNAGDSNIRIFEEILMFFESNYIDLLTLNGQIEALKSEIENQEAEHPDNEKSTGNGDSSRQTNVYIFQLKQQLHAMENRVNSRIDPVLREFLQCVNLLLLFQKIRSLLESTLKSTDQANVAARTENLKQIIITFLWLYKKILPESFKAINKKSFIMDTIHNMGFNNALVTRAVVGKHQLQTLIDDITSSMKSTSPEEDELDEGFDTIPSTENEKLPVDYINDLMELLYRITYNKDDNIDTIVRLHNNSGKNREKRFPFHEPGSFKITLKVASDYCIDSLIFMVSWLQREFKKGAVPKVSQFIWGPVMDSLVQAEYFMHAYVKAVNISSQHENQSQSAFTGEIRQYIPREHARQLIRLIQHGCDAMYAALVDTSILIAENPFNGGEQLLKRIQIARESFDNARDKIAKGTRSIKP